MFIPLMTIFLDAPVFFILTSMVLVQFCSLGLFRFKSAHRVYFYLLGLLWSILVYLVQFILFGPLLSIGSILVHFDSIWSIRSTLILFSLFSPILPFNPIWSTLDHLVHLLKNGKKKKVWVESKGVRGLMVWFLAIFSIILCGVVFSFYFFFGLFGFKNTINEL